jgi:hypothetical protein
MKNEVIISVNCSKNAFNAQRLIETFCAKYSSLLNVRDNAANIEGGIILPVCLTLILTQVIEYSNGLILYFNFNISVWKKLLHMEYYIKSLVKPEPIEIKKAKNLRIINN